MLAFGDRGTGKSTAVRALAALLPPVEAVAGCPVNSARAEDCPAGARVSDWAIVRKPTPVVDLPLGATEDLVVGALDIERAITRWEKAFEPGLLARANLRKGSCHRNCWTGLGRQSRLARRASQRNGSR